MTSRADYALWSVAVAFMSWAGWQAVELLARLS